MRAHRSSASLDEVMARASRNAVVETRPSDDQELLRLRRRAIRTHRFGLTDADEDLLVHDRLYETRPLSIAKSWVLGPLPVLVMIGDRRTGKTMAASWALLARMHAGSIGYVLEDMIAQYYWGDRRFAREWATLVAAKTLFIEEIGGTATHRATPAREGVSQLILERNGGGRKTVLTGNLDADAFAERTCPRLLGRLMTIGRVELITGPGLNGEGE